MTRIVNQKWENTFSDTTEKKYFKLLNDHLKDGLAAYFLKEEDRDRYEVVSNVVADVEGIMGIEDNEISILARVDDMPIKQMVSIPWKVDKSSVPAILPFNKIYYQRLDDHKGNTISILAPLFNANTRGVRGVLKKVEERNSALILSVLVEDEVEEYALALEEYNVVESFLANANINTLLNKEIRLTVLCDGYDFSLFEGCNRITEIHALNDGKHCSMFCLPCVYIQNIYKE